MQFNYKIIGPCSDKCSAMDSARDQVAEERKLVTQDCKLHATDLPAGKILETADHQWTTYPMKDAKLLSQLLPQPGPSARPVHGGDEHVQRGGACRVAWPSGGGGLRALVRAPGVTDAQGRFANTSD